MLRNLAPSDRPLRRQAAVAGSPPSPKEAADTRRGASRLPFPRLARASRASAPSSFPAASAGPSERAGLKLPPVSGPVTSAPAKTVAPIANGATALGVRSSVATAMMTKPRMPASTRSVAPNSPTGPRIHPHKNDAATARARSPFSMSRMPRHVASEIAWNSVTARTTWGTVHHGAHALVCINKTCCVSRVESRPGASGNGHTVCWRAALPCHTFSV
jgi:hypothetical protein